ncbi:hypothetical protein [Burkholderia ubonensis]|uniref:hypothetical protein n=1 Tax=Burkholderia ubonensis TaxID=101571 RepID=UPI00075C2BA5|nr:hypothetical protein [Burkholderia ubonensis]KVZ42987.1 hypothetical protein WL16_26845 [Burkholderia ubonensis]
MAKQQVSLREQLVIVEQRLAETLQVFAAYVTINERANKDENPTLNTIVNGRGGFWHAAAVSFQTHLFTGIYALVESGPKVVTLATIAHQINKGGNLNVPNELVEALREVRKRYEKFRHVLFGHNGKDREILADRFDEYGFTWDMIRGDLDTLEHTFKCLWNLADGKPAPALGDSKRMRFPYAVTIERMAKDTSSLLDDLAQRQT